MSSMHKGQRCGVPTYFTKKDPENRELALCLSHYKLPRVLFRELSTLPYSDCLTKEKIQCKFMRFLFFKKNFSHVDDSFRLASLYLPFLGQRRTYIDLRTTKNNSPLVWWTTASLTTSPSCHKYNIRKADIFNCSSQSSQSTSTTHNSLVQFFLQ